MKFNFLENPEGEILAVDRSVLETDPKLQGPDEQMTRLCRTLLRDLDLDDLRNRISVEWNRRMRSCAGRAFWPKGVIQLNPKLVGISETEVRQTVLHELAHLIAYERNPSRPIKSHGKEWRTACVDVGIPDEKATHELALPSRVLKRKWRYDCPKCDKVIERVRRYRGMVACYDCCLEATGGVYHDSFRLIEVNLDS